MLRQSQTLSPARWRWMTLAAGILGSSVSSGVISIIAFGLTLKPMASEFGWYRTQVSSGLACFYIFNGVGAALLGEMIVRYRARRPAAAFVVAFASALLAVAALPPSWPIFIVAFVWLGLSSGGCTSMPYAIGIAGWFDRWRGVALALAVSGTGLGHIVLPYYASSAISGFGWRGGYAALAAYVGVVGLASLAFLYRDPPISRRATAAPTPSYLEILREHREVRLLATAIFLVSFSAIGASISLPAIITDRGLTAGEAALALTVYGGANWIAKLAGGALLDRIHVRFVSGAIFLLVAIGCVVLATSAHGWAVLTGAAFVGCGVGAEADIMTYGASRYCSPDILGKAIGAIWLLMPWGAGLGVLAGSASFDIFGSYSVALAAFSTAAALAAVAALRLGSYAIDRVEG